MQIEPLKTADLPERDRPFWKMTGPGAVLVGLSIGAGEIIIWPLITAQYGATMLWAAALGVFLQLWINIEIGRWVIATGESAYTGFTRMWKGFAFTFILLNVAGWILPGWARTSGLALKALIFGPDHPSPDWLWTAITFAGVALVLFGPKRIYASLEKVVEALIIVITIGLIFIAFKIGTREHVVEMMNGLLNFGHRAEGIGVKEFFSAIVFAGAGGTSNLFYAFYLRDKQIGMGSRIPILLNPFRNREERASQTGYIFPETEQNIKRFRSWFKYIVLDQTLYFWLLNTITMFLFIFGALVVLHAEGIIPEKGRLIFDESMILAKSMGAPGRILFLLIGVATLFSTQLTIVDGVSRSLADIISTSFAFGKKVSTPTWYTGVVLFLIFFGTGLTAIDFQNFTELDFLFNAAFLGGFAMAVYVPLLLWMNLRHLPKAARPGPFNIVMLSLGSVVYVGFALLSLWTLYIAKLF